MGNPVKKLTAVQQHTKNAQVALENTNYELFMRSLIAISEENEKASKRAEANVDKSNEEAVLELDKFNTKQHEALVAFNEIWWAKEEKDYQEKYITTRRDALNSLNDELSIEKKANYDHTEKQKASYFAANNHLNSKRKEKVDLALKLFNESINKKWVENVEPARKDLKTSGDASIKEKIETNLNLAREQISGYETRTQKATRYLGVFLAAAISFAFGTVETGTALLILLALVFTSVAIPPFALLLIAAPFVAIATYVEWNIFKGYIPSLLQKVIGKEKFLDGLTDYYVKDKDPNDKTKFIMVLKHMSPKRKAALGIFTLCAALPTGIAIGALGYTSTLAISSLPFLGGLIAGAGIGAMLPPLGIALAAIVAISITCMLVKNFAEFLQKKNAWEAVKKPFKQVKKVLDQKEVSKPVRVISYIVTGVLAVASVIGLALACKAATHSLGIMLANSVNMAPSAAAGIAIAVGSVSAFVGRAWFTFKAAFESMVTIIKHVVKSKEEKEAAAAAKKEAAEMKNQSSSHLIISKEIKAEISVDKKAAEKPKIEPPKLNKKELFGAVVEAGMEIFFYAQGAMATGASLITTIYTGFFTGTRTMCMNIGGVDIPTDKAKAMKESFNKAKVTNSYNTLFSTQVNVEPKVVVEKTQEIEKKQQV